MIERWHDFTIKVKGGIEKLLVNKIRRSIVKSKRFRRFQPPKPIIINGVHTNFSSRFIITQRREDKRLSISLKV